MFFALFRVGNLRVIAGQVAHAHLAHQLVAALHLVHGPVQRVASLAHVRHHGRQQVRNAFVDGHFQHLRIDQDQAHVERVGFVQQRQDGGVDAHGFTGTGGTGHQQVRHLGKIRHDGLAGDILAQRNRQAGDAIVVHLGAEDFRQAHDLPLAVRQFQGHVILARNGFHHADGRERQRTGQVARQADDLAALDARGRLDFIARHHRAGVSGHYLGIHAKVGKFLFDQAAREFQGFHGYRFHHGRRLVQQRQRRQLAIAQAFEQVGLAFFLHALRFHHRDDLRLDLDGRRGHVLFHVLGALDDHHFVAAHGGHFALAAVFAVLVAQHEPVEGVFDGAADALGHLQPRHMEEQGKAQAEQQQQQQGGAREAEGDVGRVPHQLAQHAARVARQLHVQAFRHAQVFEAHAADQHDGEADDADQHLDVVLALRFLFFQQEALTQAAIAIPHGAQQPHAPPPGGKTEDIQQQIGKGRTQLAAQVGHLVDVGGVRPARIELVEAGQYQYEIQGKRGQREPARLRQQPYQPVGQGPAFDRFTGVAILIGLGWFSHSGKRCKVINVSGREFPIIRMYSKPYMS